MSPRDFKQTLVHTNRLCPSASPPPNLVLALLFEDGGATSTPRSERPPICCGDLEFRGFWALNPEPDCIVKQLHGPQLQSMVLRIFSGHCRPPLGVGGSSGRPLIRQGRHGPAQKRSSQSFSFPGVPPVPLDPASLDSIGPHVSLPGGCERASGTLIFEAAPMRLLPRHDVFC